MLQALYWKLGYGLRGEAFIDRIFCNAFYLRETNKINKLLESYPAFLHSLKNQPLVLHASVRANYPEMLNILLDEDADIESINEDGHSLLIVASKRNYFNIAKILIERNANIYATNGDGENSFDLAVINSHKGLDTDPLLRLLIKHGSSPNDIANFEYFDKDYIINAFKDAIKEDDVKSVKIILNHNIYGEIALSYIPGSNHLAKLNRFLEKHSVTLDEFLRGYKNEYIAKITPEEPETQPELPSELRYDPSSGIFRIMAADETSPPAQLKTTTHIAGIIAANVLIPGIRCVKDMVNGNNQEELCYKYYKQSRDVFTVKYFMQATTSTILFKLNLDSGYSLFNSILISKLSSDAITYVIDLHMPEFSTNYLSSALRYSLVNSASIVINHYLQVEDEMAKTIMINITPSLLELAGSLIYQGASAFDHLMNPNGEQVDWGYYV